ncbi:MAG: LTA synthase family protein [Clostridiales bacterium]|nr:LTA synthase family protein [Clostridiales bacterium]
MQHKIPRPLSRKKAKHKLNDRSKARYIRVNLPVSLLLILLSSLALTYICFRLQPASIEDIWKIIVESEYAIFCLNWIPILLVTLLLYAAFNNVAVACGLTSGAAILLSFVNRNMINMRQDPFKPLDILLGGEFLGIAKSIDRRLLIFAVIGVLAFLAVIACCVFFIRNKYVLHPVVHLIAAAAAIAVCVWYTNTTLSDTALYESLPMSGNRYNLTDNFESKGFIYSFLYTMNTSRIDAPPSYDKDKAAIASRISVFTPADLSGVVKPNIILILSEAFSDILLNPSLNFDSYTDPMENYKRIRDESISGHLIVPNIGGGTADTEFDIFTGLNTRHLRGTPYTYNLITKPVSALPSILAGAGYENLALHPGYGWFYNRQNVYKRMGFSGLLDSKTYDTADTKGMYITEKQTIQRIIDEYELHVETAPETPFFEFCVTIQNHGPYPGKYNAEKNFDFDKPLSEDAENAVSNYVEGMIDCDRELGVLTDYLNERPEPVILVYYGDHLPSFITEVYNALIPTPTPVDSYEQLTRLYKTPFIIWQNGAARASTPITKNFEELVNPDGEWVITSNFLGANLLSMLGFSGVDPFMDYVNDLSQAYPVILENNALTSDGSFINLSETPSEQIDFYRGWEYYWIFK